MLCRFCSCSISSNPISTSKLLVSSRIFQTSCFRTWSCLVSTPALQPYLFWPRALFPLRHHALWSHTGAFDPWPARLASVGVIARAVPTGIFHLRSDIWNSGRHGKPAPFWWPKSPWRTESSCFFDVVLNPVFSGFPLGFHWYFHADLVEDITTRFMSPFVALMVVHAKTSVGEKLTCRLASCKKAPSWESGCPSSSCSSLICFPCTMEST